MAATEITAAVAVAVAVGNSVEVAIKILFCIVAVFAGTVGIVAVASTVGCAVGGGVVVAVTLASTTIATATVARVAVWAGSFCEEALLCPDCTDCVGTLLRPGPQGDGQCAGQILAMFAMPTINSARTISAVAVLP